MRKGCYEYSPTQIIPAPIGVYWAAYDEGEDDPIMDPIDFFALCNVVYHSFETGKDDPQDPTVLAMVLTDTGLELLEPETVSNSLGVFRGNEKTARIAAKAEQSRHRTPRPNTPETP